MGEVCKTNENKNCSLAERKEICTLFSKLVEINLLHFNKCGYS